MIWIIAIACILLVALAAVWFSPLRSQLLKFFTAISSSFSRASSFVDRFRFRCYVEQFSDESQPAHRDQFFKIEIFGRIPTDRDNVDTDIQIEILDITEGESNSYPVLSADELYHDQETAEFHFIQHNGIVPDKNAVLARKVTVSQIPCHILRFAYRGRRKLLFNITVIEKETGQKLVSARDSIEYVYCSDGYREVHGRRLEVLQNCIALSAVILGSPPYPKMVIDLWSEWIQFKTEMVLPADEIEKIVQAIQDRFNAININHSADVILAYGKNTDRFFAIELALQAISLDGYVSAENLEKLFQISEKLEVRQDRLLSMTQKCLLSLNCQIEEPSQLLGITSDMDDEVFRKRLNEEYRKWNSRVTHPDTEVRNQADQILNLIADIRNRRLQSNS